MDCNTLFLKVKHGDFNHYAIKELNSVTKDTIIRTLYDEEAAFLENIVKVDGNSVCKYDVNLICNSRV